MTTEQNARDYVLDKQIKGIVFTYGPNVEIIRMIGIKVINGRIPSSVRKELNEAVKAGYLGRLKKEKYSPEIYFHPNSKPRAISKRDEIVNNAIEALKKIY